MLFLQYEILEKYIKNEHYKKKTWQFLPKDACSKKFPVRAICKVKSPFNNRSLDESDFDEKNFGTKFIDRNPFNKMSIDENGSEKSGYDR